jgi:hypothetical protein
MTTLVPPHVEDGQLLLDVSETRQILLFFWPMRSDDINAMPVDNPLRRFAQSILIAAIDASYAMGYLHRLGKTVANPRGGLKAMGQKLARHYLQHWWRHAKVKDLEDVKIYETVRREVARVYLHRLNMHRDGVANTQPLSPFVLAGMAPDAAAWA